MASMSLVNIGSDNGLPPKNHCSLIQSSPAETIVQRTPSWCGAPLSALNERKMSSLRLLYRRSNFIYNASSSFILSSKTSLKHATFHLNFTERSTMFHPTKPTCVNQRFCIMNVKFPLPDAQLQLVRNKMALQHAKELIRVLTVRSVRNDSDSGSMQRHMIFQLWPLLQRKLTRD